MKLNTEQASQMATTVYIGQVALDVNLYRDTVTEAKVNTKEATARFGETMARHVKAVKATQDYFQRVS